MIKIHKKKKNKFDIVLGAYNKTTKLCINLVVIENVSSMDLAQYLERQCVDIFYIASILLAFNRQGYEKAYLNKNNELMYLS